MAEIENLKIGSGGTIHIVGNEDIVAEAWAAGQSYVKDKSYVINNHILYVCNTSHTSTSPFDPTNWTQITVGKSLGDMLSAIPASASDLPYAAGVSTADAIGVLSNLDTSTQTSLVAAINELVATSKLNPVYGNTASGSIATFDTSLALPLQDCTIAINGTNLTGANVSVSGVNLWNETTKNGYWDITTGNYVNSTGQLCSNDYIPVKENTEYYFYKGSDVWQSEVLFYDKSKTFIGHLRPTQVVNKVFTTPSNCAYITFNMGSNYGASYLNDMSLNYPSSNTDYHAYNPNSTTTAILWNGLGTVSEGSFDVTMGKLTVVNGSMGAGEYQITPIPINQLSGTNNIFCDTGNTSIVYACSLKDYIDGQ